MRKLNAKNIKLKVNDSILLSDNEFQRLQLQSKVLTKEEEVMICLEKKREKQRLVDESEMRKKKLQDISIKQEKRVAVDLENKDTLAIQQNITDNEKRANGLRLKAEVKAMLDKQVAEKRMIEKAKQQEDKRLDLMMADQRTKFFEEVLKKSEENRKKKKRYEDELIEEREQLIAKKMMAKEKETEQQRRYKELEYIIMMEDLERMRKMKQEAVKARHVLNKANEEIMKNKEKEVMEEKVAIMRETVYQKEKDRREKKEEERRSERSRKAELRLAQERKLQAKLPDIATARENAAILRNQEDYERELRKKEAKEKARREWLARDLKQALQVQIQENTLKNMARLEEKRNNELQRQVQIAGIERDRLRELKKKYDQEMYRELLLRQINQHEETYIKQRQDVFSEEASMTWQKFTKL